MFLTKCDQEKYINVAWEAFKAGLFCPLTSSLLRDHLSPSVKEQLRIVRCLSFVTFLTKCDQNKQFLFGWQTSVCKQFLSTDLTFITTRSQYMGKFLSPKVLAKFWQPAGSKKLYCWGMCGTLRCTAFCWCISWVRVYLAIVGQKKDFLQKSAQKTAFLRDTNLDHLTLEGCSTHNFKDRDLS